MATDTNTTDLSYWVNWRFFISALSVMGIVIFSFYLIWKHEGKKKRDDDETSDFREVPVGVLYTDELWKTCLKDIHPVWLFLYRIIALCVLSTLIVGNTVASSPRIFYFYTQWTFTLTTIYFGFAAGFSLYGFCHEGACHSKTTTQNADDLENSCNRGEVHVRQFAGFTGYLFQVMFQVTAGAVLLTDVVYWLVLYLIFTPKDKKLDFFTVCMHTVNVLILGDAALNCMRFPMFRIAYFSLWTSVFVICQWIIHVFISIPWPYPFMDLSPPYSPIWYLAVGILQVPCYGFFALIVKLKQRLLSRSFPDSCQVLR